MSILEERAVDGYVLFQTSISRFGCSSLQIDMFQKSIPTPGVRSKLAEMTIYKCRGAACKTKGKGCRYVDVLLIVFLL